MQYHEVKINIELNEVKNCYWSASYANSTWTTDLSAVKVDSLPSCSLFVDYIYLDTDERRRRLDCAKKVYAINVWAPFMEKHLFTQGDFIIITTTPSIAS